MKPGSSASPARRPTRCSPASQFCLSAPEEPFEPGLPEHLGDHVLGDGSQGVQQLALQPRLHDQQIHVYLGEGKCRSRQTQGEKKWPKVKRRGRPYPFRSCERTDWSLGGVGKTSHSFDVQLQISRQQLVDLPVVVIVVPVNSSKLSPTTTSRKQWSARPAAHRIPITQWM